MYYIYSTLSQDHQYTRHVAGAGLIRTVQKAVLIKGGTAILKKNALETPLGVVTAVSDEDYDFLCSVTNFKEHVKKGFISAQKVKKDPKKIAANLNAKDGGAQLTKSDFDEDGKPKPLDVSKTDTGGADGD